MGRLAQSAYWAVVPVLVTQMNQLTVTGQSSSMDNNYFGVPSLQK